MYFNEVEATITGYFESNHPSYHWNQKDSAVLFKIYYSRKEPLMTQIGKPINHFRDQQMLNHTCLTQWVTKELRWFYLFLGLEAFKQVNFKVISIEILKKYCWGSFFGTYFAPVVELNMTFALHMLSRVKWAQYQRNTNMMKSREHRWLSGIWGKPLLFGHEAINHCAALRGNRRKTTISIMSLSRRWGTINNQ